MLSLSPRYDLFKFSFPKDFLPNEIIERYSAILNKDSAVIYSPIDYLNESIQGVDFPGISDVLIQQVQHGHNSIVGKNKINVEPQHEITYTSPENPLSKINPEFKVTFRMNQGLYNYFMLYETIFYHICKPTSRPVDPVLYIELLNEEGIIVSRIKFIDVYINGIDGLEFQYDKTKRDTNTFDVSFRFNNIDFEFL